MDRPTQKYTWDIQDTQGMEMHKAEEITTDRGQSESNMFQKKCFVNVPI